MGHDFENAAKGVAGFQNLVDFLFHALFDVGIGAVEKNLFAIVQGFESFPMGLARRG